MNKRERMLLIGLVAVGGLGVTYALVYPKVIRPLFDVSKDIAKAGAEQAELKKELARFDADTVRYEQYVRRTGGTDAKRVQDAFYARINDLIKQSDLDKGRVSPKPLSVQRSSLQKVGFTIQAEGTWDNVVAFIRRFYELPHVAQCTDLRLGPAGTRRNTRDTVKISGTIEVLVLPKVRNVGDLDGQSGADEGERIKYTLADASPLSRQPFLEYQEPRLPRPKPEPTVAEGSEEAETPPGPTVDFDPARTRKFVRATWNDSVRVKGARPNDGGEWLTLGERLDGGEIVLVHPLGAVVRRPDGEFVYPLGKRLSAAIKLEDATAYPEIQVAMGVHVEEEEEPAELDEDREAASAAGWDDWRRLLRPRSRSLGGLVDDTDLCGPPYDVLAFDPGWQEPEPEPEPEEPPADTEIAPAGTEAVAAAETEPDIATNGLLDEAEPAPEVESAEPVETEEEEVEPSDLVTGTADDQDVDTDGLLDDADEESETADAGHKEAGDADTDKVHPGANIDEIDANAGTTEMKAAEPPSHNAWRPGRAQKLLDRPRRRMSPAMG